MSWVQPRVLGIPQIKSLRDRLDNWVDKVHTALLSVEAETPDLVASWTHPGFLNICFYLCNNFLVTPGKDGKEEKGEGVCCLGLTFNASFHILLNYFLWKDQKFLCIFTMKLSVLRVMLRTWVSRLENGGYWWLLISKYVVQIF